MVSDNPETFADLDGHGPCDQAPNTSGCANQPNAVRVLPEFIARIWLAANPWLADVGKGAGKELSNEARSTSMLVDAANGNVVGLLITYTTTDEKKASDSTQKHAMVATSLLVMLIPVGGEEAGAAKGGTVLARELGNAGEAAVRAAFDIGPTTRISINGVFRFPDGLTETVLSEVKNTAKLSFTSQLRDYAAFALDNGMRFDLYMRESVKMSGPLREAIESGLINALRIPGAP